MSSPEQAWRKASYSQGDISNCVEVCVELTDAASR